MSFKINNSCKPIIARNYKSAFKSKRNPDMYTAKRTDSYNFSSTYSAILGSSYSTQFMRSMETYLSSEETEKKSPTADQTPESAMGVKGGYRSRTVMNNPYHAQKINELRVQSEQAQNEAEYSAESQLSDLLFDMKTRMNFML